MENYLRLIKYSNAQFTETIFNSSLNYFEELRKWKIVFNSF